MAINVGHLISICQLSMITALKMIISLQMFEFQFRVNGEKNWKHDPSLITVQNTTKGLCNLAWASWDSMSRFHLISYILTFFAKSLKYPVIRLIILTFVNILEFVYVIIYDDLFLCILPGKKS